MTGQKKSAYTVLINGEATDRISISDRGLLYGDGLFETLAVYEEQPLLWHEHYERLAQSADQLQIPIPAKQLLSDELTSVCAGLKKAVAKIILTRGVGGRGYSLPDSVSASRIISTHAWPSYPKAMIEEGVNIRVCDFRLAKQPGLSGLKHLNRLEQIMARSEWSDPGIFEGLLLDQEQHVIEGTMSNVFLINDNQLLTPDLSDSGVNGIIRQLILATAPEMGYRVSVTSLSLNDVLQSKEIFLCNSLMGVCPVRQLNNTVFSNRRRSQEIREHFIQQSRIVAL